MKKDVFFGYKMIIPATLLISFVSLYPLAMGIYYSFTNLRLGKKDSGVFIAFDNFIRLFKDPNFSDYLTFTVLLAIGIIGISYILGLTLAHLLNRDIRFVKLFRVLFLIPWLTPPIVVVIMWRLILNSSYGVLNKFLVDAGITEKSISFLGDPVLAKFSVLLISIWIFLPFMIIVLLSALQGIPSELYEAAYIDGASFFQALINITMPAIKNISAIVLLLTFIWAFNFTELIILLTGGGPLRSTTTLPVAVYQIAIKGLDFGYGAALAVLVLVVVAIVGIFYLRIQERE